jgi:hypothetical protein
VQLDISNIFDRFQTAGNILGKKKNLMLMLKILIILYKRKFFTNESRKHKTIIPFNSLQVFLNNIYCFKKGFVDYRVTC